MPNRPTIDAGWEVEGIEIASCFFSAVAHLLPPPVHLYFEGNSIASDVWALLQSRAVSPQFQIPRGTIWPKPRTMHVLATADFLRELAAQAELHAEPEICDHLHAYSESKLLLEWYDAFDLPLLVDGSIPEATVREFCRKAGGSYKPFPAR